MKGCKNCPAYAKCTVTYRGSACAALRGTYGLGSDPEIITNADRIRSMSDEELAKVLCTADFCGFCDYEKENGTCRYFDMHPDGRLFDGCVQAAKKWLKSPAEEEP